MIAADHPVPRETLRRLQTFGDLLTHWNSRLNLVSSADVEKLWPRHITDSAQLARWAPDSARTWLDLGSGAGFPALVCAAILNNADRRVAFTLVEADKRKAGFLREAARQMDLDVSVLGSRIEAVSLPSQGVISARALAPLPRLLRYAARFSDAATVMLFPKGRQADSELTLARRDWHIRAVRIPSRTDPDAVILRLTEVCPRR